MPRMIFDGPWLVNPFSQSGATLERDDASYDF